MLHRLLSAIRKDRSSCLKNQAPSTVAIEAATDYYAGLYQERSPDPAAFLKLCQTYGVPDWPNPYPVGQPEHYQIHPDGFLFADLEAILVDMIGDREDDHPVEDAPRWPDPSQAAVQSFQENDVFRRQCAKAARHCWAHLLASGKPAPRLSSAVHPDNIWLVNMEILRQAMDGTWLDVDPARVAEGMHNFV